MPLTVTSEIVYQSDFEDGENPWNTSLVDDRFASLVVETDDGGNDFITSTGPWWIDPNHADPGAGYLNLLFFSYLADLGAGPTDFHFSGATLTVDIRPTDFAIPEGAHVYFWFQAYDAALDRYVNYLMSSTPIEDQLVDGEWRTVSITLSAENSDWTALGSSADRTSYYGTSVSIAHALSSQIVDLGIFLFLGNDLPPAEAPGSVSFDNVSITLDPNGVRSFMERDVNAGPQRFDIAVNVDERGSGFDGVVLEASIGGIAEDEILTVSGGVAGLSITSDEIWRDGVLIAHFTGGTGSTLAVTFNADATTDAIEAVIYALGYSNSSDDPATSRSVSVTLTDTDTTATPVASFELRLVPEPESDEDNIYVFTDSSNSITALFDEGGTDTIDASLVTVNSTISLKSGYYPPGAIEIYTVGSTIIETVLGGSGLDVIRGSVSADTVEANDGNDIIYGEEGDDTLRGGAGNDALQGGPGADLLDGGSDYDIAYFSERASGVIADLLNLDSAAEDIFVSVEALSGSGYDDKLLGDANGNLLLGVVGDDLLVGREGNDQLDGGDGNDVLDGGADDDTLSGGDGDDQMFGGLGNDLMIWSPGDDSDLMEGGDGSDTAEVNGGGGSEVFAATANGVRVRFDRVDPAPFALDIGTTETLVLNMNDGDDTFSTTDNLAVLISLSIDGGAGNDTILGGNGIDLLMGGDDNDFIDGNQANDTAFLGNGDDIFRWDPGDGSDVVEGQSGTDQLLFNGSAANEIFDLNPNGGRVQLLRNVGAITMDLNGVETFSIDALSGTDSINVNNLTGTDATQVAINLSGTVGGTTGDGEADTVTVAGTGSNDVIGVTGAGTSISVTGLAASIDVTNSESANDTLIINGLDGNDSITATPLPGGVVNLILDGGMGSDTIHASQGADVILGGGGNDVLVAHDGNDMLNGGAGSDTMEGGLGDDSFYVDSASDLVSESAGQGTDRVFAEVSYTLALGVSVETLSTDNNVGTAAIVLTGNEIANNIYGNFGNNALWGGGGNDVLVAYDGNDMLNGGAGSDTMEGGLGDDSFYVDSASDLVSESAGQGTDRVFAEVSYTLALGVSVETLSTDNNVGTAAIVLTGNEIANNIYGNFGNNALWGGGGNDVLVAYDGNDMLNGGAGSDTMEGGLGDDSFYVDSASDLVSESAGQGTDRVFAEVSYTLALGVSVETLSTDNNVGTAAIVLTGNEIANNIYGNFGNNALWGGGGNDVLVAHDGNDMLNGGAGSDTMEGGLGDDSFYVDSASDLVSESAGQGTDRVFAEVSYTLALGVSVETLSTDNNVGTAAIVLTGNEIANNIYGNFGNNALWGGGGNDVLVAHDGNDMLNGGAGSDTMEGGLGDDSFYVDSASDLVSESAGQGTDRVFAEVSYTLALGVSVETLSTDNNVGTAAIVLTGNEIANNIYGNFGNNALWGGGGNDVLVAHDGNDMLNGGAGSDTMEGGLGDDSFYVDSASDLVSESAGQGTDRVFAEVSYTLALGVSVETLSTDNNVGTAAIVLTGNEIANNIYGNFGNNALWGGGGNDVLVAHDGNDILNGGTGADVLSGGAGQDSFRFTTALGSGNIDTVSDYAVADDSIELDDAVFAGLTAGALPDGAFASGSAAQDADDRIIYDSATGALLFDADGTGSAAAVQFAALAAGLPLTANEFLVI